MLVIVQQQKLVRVHVTPKRRARTEVGWEVTIATADDSSAYAI